ncbi:MAG TPA: dihydroxyacetone kinase subunit DhaK [Clostridium sp.]|uniref:dihydroxyacetone kinase subunit DhaK n=1 Tax=Clostridium sp. TaxID=1506 RepID=UPI002F93FA00
MKKIINQGSNVVEEMMEGYLTAYSRFYTKIPNINAFTFNERRKNKVSLVVGGGTGHEPLFSGFVGRGLADAVVCGNIFTSPNPQIIYETAKEVDEGKGIIFIYGNYAGDNLNFDMGEEFCEEDNIKVAHVRVWDDCASAPKEKIEDRRGIAGDVFVIKVAGAACDEGLELDEVVRITEKARDNINTIGLATSAGSIPGLDKPTFELGENEIEYGMGIHGEQGIKRTTMKSADELVNTMYDTIKKDMQLSSKDEICILVNGLGSTTLLELNIVYRRLSQLLKQDNIKTFDSEIKNYCTCQEMGGFSITILRLDDEIKKYYCKPCFSPYYAKEEIK